MPAARITATIFNLKGKPTAEKIDLPAIFSTPIRPDVIKRAVLSIQSKRLQPQGRDPMAGKRTTAESRGTGMAMARVPRVKGGGGRAKFAPSTVGGRQPHPPTSQKTIVKRITKKESRLALFSAIAATASKKVVSLRGHSIEEVLQIPLVVTDDLAKLSQTKEVEEVFSHLGVGLDVDRVRASRKIRAGKGKRRGRKMKQAVGPLVVVGHDRGLVKAAANLPGVDVATVNVLNTELLAPGASAGRLTLWTIGAIEQLGRLYSEEVVA
jgi:large subunit ribosomal protein L4e